jgi:alkylation response protein AidB-like acyl-CoA dehydrogenase
MLDFSLSADQLAVQEMASSIGRDVLRPVARQAEVESTVPAEVWRRLIDSGLATLVPERFGGDGVPDMLTRVVGVEQLAAGDPGCAFAAVSIGAAALILDACGTESQRARLLPPLVSDPSQRPSVAYLEGFGRGRGEWSTSFEALDDGRRRVRGRKVAVPYAAEPGAMIVLGNDAASGKMRAAILDPQADGVSIVPSGRFGELGLRAVPRFSVNLDTVVEPENVLGLTTDPADRLTLALMQLRLSVAAVMLGCGGAALDYAANYATSRVAFDKPISAFQGVAFMIADGRMRIDALRLELWDCAARLERGLVEPANADENLEADVSAVIAYAAHSALAVTRDAVQVLGGHGYITDHPVERWFRDAASLSSFETDPLESRFLQAI